MAVYQLKRRNLLLVLAIFLCFFFAANYLRPDFSRYLPGTSTSASDQRTYRGPHYSRLPPEAKDWSSDGQFHWANVAQQYPPPSYRRLPPPREKGRLVQHQDWKETPEQKLVREQRRNAVLGNFTHAWKGYKTHAWLKDEVGPLTGTSYDVFGGWAASLVDSLDTLLIMGLHDEYANALAAVQTIDFSTCTLSSLNVFETTIRYLGGLLAAYDLSGEKDSVLLRKILELAEMVYKAFDTPNRMPITHWDFESAKAGNPQQADMSVIVAEISSFQMEMARLSQITGDDRFYDTAARVTEEFERQQMSTQLPGLFPLAVDARNAVLNQGKFFTIGGMVDSLYEYLPKTHLILGGAAPEYKMIYERAFEAMKEHILYRPMTPDGRDVLLAGQARVTGDPPEVTYDHQAQHLACFVGGMIGLASRAFDRPQDMEVALKAAKGCAWAYETAPLGIMPEIFYTVPCPSSGPCEWDAEAWYEGVKKHSSMSSGSVEEEIKSRRIPEGVVHVENPAYYLRPEAIESVFVLYRLTGDRSLLESAWEMFNAIVAATWTDIGAAALDDCTNPNDVKKTDKMESFWMAETLKYFYLIFSEPSVVSLDEYVLNTEAHPLKRPPV